MKKIQWLALASLSTVAVAAGAWASGEKSTSGSSAPSTAQPASKPVQADKDRFQPSGFEGVSVRQRPSSASVSGSKAGPRAWIALKPGEPRSGGEPTLRPFTLLSKSKGTTALGGNKLTGMGLMHIEVATRDASGRITDDCQPAGQTKVQAQAASSKRGQAAQKQARTEAGR